MLKFVSFRMPFSNVLGLILLISLSFQSAVYAQKIKSKKVIQKILKSKPEQFKKITDSPEKYRVQILYTQINRDARNNPSFKSYGYRVNPEEYFYPASTVKLPAALVALEKINELHIPGLTKYTPLKIDSAYAGQSAVKTDITAQNNLPSVAHYIKKILLVSDNDAYNRLYEFIGQQKLNNALHQKGFRDVKLVHRLSIFLTPDENRHTNPVTFYEGDKIIYQQPLTNNPTPFENTLKNTKLSKGYYQGEKLINEPMEFGAKNYISVEALQGILKSLLFPETVPASQRFNLTPDDYNFLYKYMSMLPRESNFPGYNPQEYPDSYAKFLVFADAKEPLPRHIRIFNKIGDAYGFAIDNAYVVDFENKVEFMLTAVIYANEDDILNDEKYNYDDLAYPFMKTLGQAIYQHELKRKKKHLPNLDRFQINYGE